LVLPLAFELFSGKEVSADDECDEECCGEEEEDE
jgi:hypothetical protein